MVIGLLATLTAFAQTDDFNPTNPPEPKAMYRLTVTAQPAEAATMSGGGQYSENASVTARATARTNYVFKHWLQNGTQLASTSTSLSFKMPAEDVSLVAVFEYQNPEDKPFDPANPAEPQPIEATYKLYLVAEPAGGGTFNRTSGKTAKEGETVSLRATAATDYQFLGWYDSDGVQLGTSTSLSFKMPAKHTTLTARFTRQHRQHGAQHHLRRSGNEDHLREPLGQEQQRRTLHRRGRGRDHAGERLHGLRHQDLQRVAVLHRTEHDRGRRFPQLYTADCADPARWTE